MNLAILAVAAGIGLADPAPLPQSMPVIIDLSQSWSCSPRRYCTGIATCEEAQWYYQNCSWGYRLDGDSDGVPCEDLCGQSR